MLLAVETETVFLHYGIDEGVRTIRDAGFDAVDLDFCDNSTELLCRDDYIEKAHEVKESLAKHGVACNQAHAPYFFRYGMAMDDSEFLYLAIKRSIEAAGIIGIDHIVLHGVNTPQPAASRANLEYNYKYLKGFEPLCEKHGVRIALENVSYAFRYPDLLNGMIEKLDSPWYTALVDIGHAWLRGGLQPGEFIRQLNPGILTGLHIHDNHGPGSDDEHLLPYLGTIDFEDLVRALKETDYRGDFTFEACAYLPMYEKHGLLKEALRFEAAVGRKLMADFENA